MNTDDTKKAAEAIAKRLREQLAIKRPVPQAVIDDIAAILRKHLPAPTAGEQHLDLARYRPCIGLGGAPRMEEHTHGEYYLAELVDSDLADLREQVRVMREQTIEECAKVADKIVKNNGMDYEDSDGAFEAAVDIAKQLRLAALTPTKEAGKPESVKCSKCGRIETIREALQNSRVGLACSKCGGEHRRIR